MMSLNIKQCPNFPSLSIKIHNIEKKFSISRFADDIDLFISSCTETNKALSYVEKFGKVSGLGLNFSKTEGLKLGPD